MSLLSRVSLAWIVLITVLSGCSTLPGRPEPPRVNLVGLKLVSVELFEQRYEVSLRIKNPNAYELPIEGIDFQLDINGQAFADGVSNRQVSVPAYGEEVVALEVSSNLIKVFRHLQSLENSRSPAFEYRVSGSIAVGSYGQRIPFDYSGDMQLSSPVPPAGSGDV